MLRALVLATLGRVAGGRRRAARPRRGRRSPARLGRVGAGRPRSWRGSAQITNTWQLGRVLQAVDRLLRHDGRLPRPGRARAGRRASWPSPGRASGRPGCWPTSPSPRAGELRKPGDVRRADRRSARRRGRRSSRPPPGPQDELVAYFDAADGLNADPERWVGWLTPRVRQGPGGHPPAHHHAGLPRLPGQGRRHLLDDAGRVRRHRDRRPAGRLLPHGPADRGPPGRAPGADGRAAPRRPASPGPGAPAPRAGALGAGRGRGRGGGRRRCGHRGDAACGPRPCSRLDDNAKGAANPARRPRLRGHRGRGHLAR